VARFRRALPSAFGASVAVHAALLTLALLWAGFQPQEVATKVPPIRTNLVFLQTPGPGGGGGGHPAPAPPQPLEIPPHPAPVVPLVAVPLPAAPPPPALDARVETSLATVLQGSGTNPLAPPGPGGGGRGTGLGDGDGPGVGPGTGGNTGGGPRRLGDGVTSPEPLYRAKPQYTNGAMQARITGSVTVEAVVLADGTVGIVKVVQSLDKVHGLDLEALKAARKWTFKPGLYQGRPVDVIVQIILDFNLR
jgi:protein TonB